MCNSLREAFHADAFRQVLTNQAVRVFIGTAFPEVMRRDEVEARLQRRFYLLVRVKFRAIVDCACTTEIAVANAAVRSLSIRK